MNKNEFLKSQAKWLSPWDFDAIEVSWFAWYTLYHYCPGWVKNECDDHGIPLFGIRLGWIRKELLYRMMVLLAPRKKRRVGDFDIKGDARSMLGRPHVLLSDLFVPRIVKTPSIDGVSVVDQWWQFRYLLACFLYNFWLVIRKIYGWRRFYKNIQWKSP